MIDRSLKTDPGRPEPENEGSRRPIGRNQAQLALIAQFASICHDNSIEYWLRGGWAMDFFVGWITRDHEDIDLFVQASDVGRLTQELRRAGFDERKGPPPGAQRDFTKNGEELQAALINRNPVGRIEVAGGPWAGAPWPDGMLDGTLGRIGNLVCPIVSPGGQIEIKERFREWRPDSPQREKHEEDIVRLREALRPARPR